MMLKHANKISNSNKKTLHERLISSIFIASFFVIVFVLGMLAGTINPLFNISMLTKRICAWSLLVFILPIIIIACKEIANMFFRFNSWAFLGILVNAVMLIYGPTMVYFLRYYQYINIPFGEAINEINTVTNIFSIILGICIVLTILTNTILLWTNRELNFKNWFILNLIVGLSSGFFLSILFFIFVRGWLVLLWLMVIVFSCDSFSYFGGLLFGKHKMAPKISPKKTWEGFGIGQVLTITIALLMLFGLSYIDNQSVLKQIMGIQFTHVGIDENVLPSNSWKWWIVMFFTTIILSLLSVIGDIIFSWFKRKYRIKDYGYIIPGHGGIIDRIDSHSIVISFYFVLSFFLALFAQTIVFFGN